MGPSGYRRGYFVWQTLRVISQLPLLERFVVRGRRIEAHSLAKDREQLLQLSRLTMTGHIGLDGTMELRRSLPDEELFESLATRVRPVLVNSESVHFRKVLSAIETAIMTSGTDVSQRFNAEFAALRADWETFDLNSKKIVRFAIQTSTIDGSEVSPQVSDTQLASAWLYADLVHVDAHGHKKHGLRFPVKERYAAAVPYFAHTAVLCVTTLEMIKALHSAGVINLEQESIVKDVVVGVDELVEKSVAYIAPVGGPMPSLDLAMHELPEDFKPFTVTELLRQKSHNQVQVHLTAHDGSTISKYEAAVSQRVTKDGRWHWETLVAGSVTFEISMGVVEGVIVNGQFESIRFHATTNRMQLAEALLTREMIESHEISFHISGQKWFSLAVPAEDLQERASLDVQMDTLLDLVTIENIIGKTLKSLTGTYHDPDRALLRRTRLLWEGEIVPFKSGPLPLTVPTGVEPRATVMQATQMLIGDTAYPVPTTWIRHPLMVTESIQAVEDSDPPMNRRVMVVPLDEPFVAWAPEKRVVTDDTDLVQPAPWDLSHFDEQGFLGCYVGGRISLPKSTP